MPIRTRHTHLRTVAVGLVVVASLIGGVAATDATPAAAAPTAVGDGSLDWGIRSSFRTYVEGSIAKGSVTASQGASRVGNIFSFPIAGGDFDPNASTVDADFDGTVRFVGHDYGNGPLLDLTLSDLHLVVTGTTGVIVADIASTELENLSPGSPVTEPVQYPDTTLATLNLAGITPTAVGAGWRWSNVPATLTAEGAPAFGGFYTAGAALDPVTFTLSASRLPAYAPLTPARLVDTRLGEATVDAQYAGIGVRLAASTTEVVVAGRGGLPANVAAAVLNVTVTGATADGFLTVWPCGTARPNASSVNYSAGRTVANAVTAKIGTAGRVCFYAHSPLHLVVDVSGSFGANARYVPANPARLADTRPGATTVDSVGAGGGPVGPASILTVPVTNRAGVPASIAAAVLNVAATEATGTGFLTVWACDAPRPLASNLNFGGAGSASNAVVSQVSAAGTICVFANVDTQVVVDVNGWFGTGSGLTPVVPTRMHDTRAAASTVDGFGAGGGPVSPASTVAVRVAGRGAVPLGTSTVVVNLTITEPVGGGFATVHPCGIAAPLASSINFAAGQTVANVAVAAVDASGDICVTVAGAPAHLVVDVAAILA